MKANSNRVFRHVARHFKHLNNNAEAETEFRPISADVVFVHGKETFRAHKLVLAHLSPALRAALDDKSASEHVRVVVVDAEFAKDVVKRFVQLAYTGKASFKANVKAKEEFMAFAEAIGVKSDSISLQENEERAGSGNGNDFKMPESFEIPHDVMIDERKRRKNFAKSRLIKSIFGENEDGAKGASNSASSSDEEDDKSRKAPPSDLSSSINSMIKAGISSKASSTLDANSGVQSELERKRKRIMNSLKASSSYSMAPPSKKRVRRRPPRPFIRDDDSESESSVSITSDDDEDDEIPLRRRVPFPPRRKRKPLRQRFDSESSSSGKMRTRKKIRVRVDNVSKDPIVDLDTFLGKESGKRRRKRIIAMEDDDDEEEEDIVERLDQCPNEASSIVDAVVRESPSKPTTEEVKEKSKTAKIDLERIFAFDSDSIPIPVNRKESS